MPGEHAVNGRAGGRRHGARRGDGCFAHPRLSVLERVQHLRQRRLDAQVLHVGEVGGREGLLARAQEFLADPLVLVPPPDGLLAEDIRRRGDSEFHEGHQEVPRSLAHGRLEIPEAIEHAWEERRDVLAEEVG